jgi:hypothetical protein
MRLHIDGKLRCDVIAGLTAAAVVPPKAVDYSARARADIR